MCIRDRSKVDLWPPRACPYTFAYEQCSQTHAHVQRTKIKIDYLTIELTPGGEGWREVQEDAQDCLQAYGLGEGA